MSITDKIGSLMARPNDDLVAKDDVPWWMKYSARGLGTVGGGLAIFLGVWNGVFILFGNVDSFLSGVWQMLLGFAVLAVEAPCCCMFVDFVQTFSDKIEKRPYWHRGAAYCLLSIPPVLMYFGLSSFFGCGAIFATGVLYGLMGLGKKASADEMKTTARDDVLPSISPGNMNSSLVPNEHLTSFTLPPPYDSNV